MVFDCHTKRGEIEGEGPRRRLSTVAPPNGRPERRRRSEVMRGARLAQSRHKRGSRSMKSTMNSIIALLRPLFLLLCLQFHWSAAADATTLSVVKPVSACGELAKIEWTGLEGAPARIDAAEEVRSADGRAGYCKVTGYIASDVRFEVRLPLDGWTQRFLMVGCGGYWPPPREHSFVDNCGRQDGECWEV